MQNHGELQYYRVFDIEPLNPELFGPLLWELSRSLFYKGKIQKEDAWFQLHFHCTHLSFQIHHSP